MREAVAFSPFTGFDAGDCGHDAPIYGVVKGIIERSGTPYSCCKNLDENKPAGSVKIDVETIDYFLKRYCEVLIKRRTAENEIEVQLAHYERPLRKQMKKSSESPVWSALGDLARDLEPACTLPAGD